MLNFYSLIPTAYQDDVLDAFIPMDAPASTQQQKIDNFNAKLTQYIVTQVKNRKIADKQKLLEAQRNTALQQFQQSLSTFSL